MRLFHWLTGTSVATFRLVRCRTGLPDNVNPFFQLTMTTRRHFAPALSFAATLGLLALSGCEGGRPTDQLAQAVQMGERPVAMSGTALFFNGSLEATVTVGRGIGKGGGGPGGPGGGGHGHGGGRPPEVDMAGMDDDSAKAYLIAKASVGSPLPPVSIHLKLHNLSKDTVTVDIQDFNSDLGDFAVRPETLALAPDQTGEPDTMVSQLGVGSDVLPFKVTLKKGKEKETLSIDVKSLIASTPGKK